MTSTVKRPYDVEVMMVILIDSEMRDGFTICYIWHSIVRPLPALRYVRDWQTKTIGMTSTSSMHAGCCC